MGWPEAMTEGLPPPYEGEPGELRGDIIDELADHLALAMKRELRRNEDEGAARRAVLARFGDPLAIARRLWWDAMKEKIMKDRLMLVGFVVVLAGVLVVLGMSWAAQSRINQALLAKLETLTTPPVARAVPENWAKLNVRVVEGTAGGPAVAGVSLTISGKAFTDSDRVSLSATTDAEGRASFGPVRPGQYELIASLAEPCPATHDSGVALYPGQAEERTMVSPSKEAAGTVKFKWQGLPEWLDPGTIIECMVWNNEPLIMSGTDWSSQRRTLRFNLAGQILEGEFSGWPGQGEQRRASEPSTLWLRESPRIVSSVNWLAGKYQLSSVRVYQPVSASTVSASAEQAWRSPAMPGQYREYALLAGGEKVFAVQGGQANALTLELPQDLLKQVYEMTPVAVSYHIAGTPDWLEPDALLEFDILGPSAMPGGRGSAGLPPTTQTTVRLKLNGQIVKEIGTQPYSPRGLPGRPTPAQAMDLTWPEALSTVPDMELLPWKYRLVSLRLYRPIPSRDPENPKALYWRLSGQWYVFPAGQRPVFEPAVGKGNVWTIELPGDWLEEVRAAGSPATRAADEVDTPAQPMGPGRPMTRPAMGPGPRVGTRPALRSQ